MRTIALASSRILALFVFVMGINEIISLLHYDLFYDFSSFQIRDFPFVKILILIVSYGTLSGFTWVVGPYIFKNVDHDKQSDRILTPELIISICRVLLLTLFSLRIISHSYDQLNNVYGFGVDFINLQECYFYITHILAFSILWWYMKRVGSSCS